MIADASAKAAHLRTMSTLVVPCVVASRRLRGYASVEHDARRTGHCSGGSGHHLHLEPRAAYARNRAAFYLLMSSCMLVVVSTRRCGNRDALRLPRVHGRRAALPHGRRASCAKSVRHCAHERGNHDRRSAGDGVVVRHDGNRHHRLRQYAGASRRVRDYARGPSRLDDSAVRRAAPRSTTRRVCGIDEFAAVPLVSWSCRLFC